MDKSTLRNFLKETIVEAYKESLVLGKKYTKEQMIALGADGWLSVGLLAKIPLAIIDGREPSPASSEGDDYVVGRKIEIPIEVEYNAGMNKFILYGGNHRVHQAELNKDTHILGFVGSDKGKFGLKWLITK